MSNYKRMYLQGYDYVFFTIVTNNRENILIENIDLLRNLSTMHLKILNSI